MNNVPITDKKPEKRICKRHLLSLWGKDRFGDWYDRCSTGHIFNEDCEELIEEGGEKNE